MTDENTTGEELAKEAGNDAEEALEPQDSIAQLAETILSTTTAWEGSFLRVDDVEVQFPNGNTSHHVAVRHPGAVGIIALDKNERVLLVRQYRTAIERVMLEIPAGKLEVGEDPMECALRELAEETGYVAGKIAYLAPVVTAPGYSDEVIHLFMATELTPGQAQPDEDEFIVSEWMDLSQLVDLVLDGKIEDGKTIIAALICDALSRRL